VAGGGGEAVLEAGVRVGLVLEAEAGLELLDRDLERLSARLRRLGAKGVARTRRD
jgi:hypothetical protein